jgi:hypothetical protein
MAKISVTVSIDTLGSPDYKSTAKALDAYELVRFVVGQGGSRLDLGVAQVGGCNYVKECKIDVPVAVTYQVASDLKDNIDNAADVRQKNDFKMILSRIESHARTHYDRVVKDVIRAWKSDVVKDLDKTLPTDKAPTSLTESKIKELVRPLVDYWVIELGYRVHQNVHEWEKEDYPKLQKFMIQHNMFVANLPVPSAPSKPSSSRPKTTFPACQVKKAPSKPGHAK